MKKKAGMARVGSSFDDFLSEEGILGDVQARAIKRVIALKLQEAMEAQQVTKALLAKHMSTSRAGLNRLLDPDNPSLTLRNLTRATTALGKRVTVSIEDAPRARRVRAPKVNRRVVQRA
jgi:antitoxin HicB